MAAASYEARAYGIHSAMPSVRAKRLCPHAVFLAGDHAHYGEVSARVMDLFRAMTPLVEPISLDEAFLDVSGARRLHGTGPEIAAALRASVLESEGLHCTVGVARVKFLAKLASQAAKPRASRQGTRPGRGVVVVDPERELAFLHPLPVQALWGVGPATLTRLERLGVRTIGDLATLPEATVVGALGASSGRHLHALANAIDDRVVQPDQAPKSIGHEETFARDHHRPESLRLELLRLSDAVATRLRAAGVAGRTVTIKVRFGDFTTITRSATIAGATDSAREVGRVARTLLDAVDPAPGVRLLGLSVSGLDDGAVRQLSFDDLAAPEDDGPVRAGTAEWTAAEAAVDAIRARFGARSVGPASLAGPDGLRIARRGQQQWGPDEAGGRAEPRPRPGG
ncbi:DNA polymerase IV [Aquihabitans sp. G128]|uniref:DNA polymerase IV n=1 Tax=Aquihabitans sp. G128 TaxID=2849779 RepID=UPI001C23E55B|nr:DNA polymerase IV [Aquihabitans sp. G128]